MAMLNAHTVAGNGPFDALRNGLAGALMKSGVGSMPDAMGQAGAQIYGMAQLQARLLAYVDVIWIMVALTAILIPLPFLMKRPKKLGPAPVEH
jgi:DHA2 family multidrug resistance protein